MVERANKPSAISATKSNSGPQPQVDISEDNSKVTARLPNGDSLEILLYGATIISWKSNGGQTENLWLSEAAALDGSKAVRGGIPVVFPVFGPPPPNHATSSLPQHGFARTSRWEFLGKSTSEASEASELSNDGSSVKLDFGLYTANLSESARKAWPHEFGLVYSVTLAKGSIRTMLNVRNEGKESFDFQCLLHTYFRINDITQTRITGLMAVPYVDKVLNATRQPGASSPDLSISSEVDRVYAKIPQSTTSIVEQGAPRFDVVRDNLEDTVVWNPWREKADAMGDFAPKDGYKHMVCVEVGQVDGWTKLEPGDTFEGGQVIKSLL